MQRTLFAVLALVSAMAAAPLAHDPGRSDSIASFRDVQRPGKIEGLTLARDGGLWVVLDNDGGEFESRLVRLRTEAKE